MAPHVCRLGVPPKANVSLWYGLQAAAVSKTVSFVCRSPQLCKCKHNSVPVLFAFEVLIEELLKNGSPELLQETSEGWCSVSRLS